MKKSALLPSGIAAINHRISRTMQGRVADSRSGSQDGAAAAFSAKEKRESGDEARACAVENEKWNSRAVAPESWPGGRPFFVRSPGDQVIAHETGVASPARVRRLCGAITV